MSQTKSLLMRSEEYYSDHDIFSSKPHIHLSSKLSVDLGKLTLEIESRKEKDDTHNIYTDTSYLYLDLTDDQLRSILEFLADEKPKQAGENSYISMGVGYGKLTVVESVSGIMSKRDKRSSEIDSIHIEGGANRIIFETFNGQNPIIEYCTERVDSDPKDRENLVKLKKFSEKILEDLRGERLTVRKEPIPTKIEESLKKVKYGHEVLGHIEDGDRCLDHGLIHPSLNSYVHAIEWAIIAYLESEGNDIIEREKDGELFYFAKGSKNLLDELEEHIDIDQTTKSKIESINSAERRWSAHHKTGSATQEEIEALRSRLTVLLRQTFG